MKNQTGNALFLILIAVALFAALSYAVTQSGRGGGGIGKEEAEIAAARLIQMVSDIQTTRLRLKIVEGYDQIIFDDSAPTTSGTCYSGEDTITPCKTIGLFHSSTGVSLFNIDFASELASTSWYWIVSRLRTGGSDVGTSAPDEFLWFDFLTHNVCVALNRKLQGTTTLGTAGATDSDSQGQAYVEIVNGVTINGPTTQATIGYLVDYEPGCMDYGGTGRYFLLYTLKEN